MTTRDRSVEGGLSAADLGARQGPGFRSARQPRGFTLLELLVVIGIMAFLIAVSVTVIATMSGQANNAATMALIQKIQGQLQQRLEAFDRHLQGWEKKEPAEYKALLDLRKLQLPQGIAVSPKQLKILVRKDLMRQNFPQRFRDLYGPDGQPGVKDLDDDGANGVDDLGEIGFPDSDDVPLAGTVRKFLTSSVNHNLKPDTESAELLYIMLTQGEVFGVSPVDAGNFTASEVHDDDNDGLPEFVDTWDQPLRFYRWPTRLIRPGGLGAALRRDIASLLIQGLPSETTPDPLDEDPDDPLGRLTSLSSVSLSPAYPNETDYHTPDTFHVPLIVSAGSDGILGLGEPNSTTSPNAAAKRLAMPLNVSDLELVDALTDNITNRNRRAGGN